MESKKELVFELLRVNKFLRYYTSRKKELLKKIKGDSTRKNRSDRVGGSVFKIKQIMGSDFKYNCSWNWSYKVSYVLGYYGKDGLRPRQIVDIITMIFEPDLLTTYSREAVRKKIANALSNNTKYTIFTKDKNKLYYII